MILFVVYILSKFEAPLTEGQFARECSMLQPLGQSTKGQRLVGLDRFLPNTTNRYVQNDAWYKCRCH